MTVRQLKERLAEHPDDALVCIQEGETARVLDPEDLAILERVNLAELLDFVGQDTIN